MNLFPGHCFMIINALNLPQNYLSEKFCSLTPATRSFNNRAVFTEERAETKVMYYQAA